MRARRLRCCLPSARRCAARCAPSSSGSLPCCCRVQGDAVEVSEPERWLRLAAPDRSLPAGDVWQTLFAHWVPNRQRQAASVASAAMQRDVAGFTADHQRRTEREASDLQDWLRRRADDICGAFVPQTGDLFGASQGWSGIGDCCPHRLSVWRPSQPTPTIHRHDVARRTVPSSCSSAAQRGSVRLCRRRF